MRFTLRQYETAIAALVEAKKQLEPDGNCCSVCGDGGHMSFECGHNPLVAVALCHGMAQNARQLHDQFHALLDQMQMSPLHDSLHWLAGYDQAFGVQLGPAKVILPDPAEEPAP